jgi:hypothetical protein
LKEAIMIRNRSDAYHRKGKKSAAYKLTCCAKSGTKPRAKKHILF